MKIRLPWTGEPFFAKFSNAPFRDPAGCYVMY